MLGFDIDPRAITAILERSAAAQGCAWIAEDVFAGRESILGIAVDKRVAMGKKG